MPNYAACPSEETRVPNDHATRSKEPPDERLHELSRHPSQATSGSTLEEAPRRRVSWITPTTIAGFYFLALLCTIVHYVFFNYLHNRVISPSVPLSTKTTSISQAYVTTISLLLVTAFRAALLASVGTCYTQLLWATFREQILKIKLIEDLFQVQTNVVRLGNRHLYLKTPILALVAVYSWLVPIATVYPPGALIVELETLKVNASFNVPTFHTKSFEDIVKSRGIAKIMCDSGSVTAMPVRVEDGQNATFLDTCYLSTLANPRVGYLTRSNLIAGEMASFSQPTAGNLSYSLYFYGVTMDCDTKNKTIERTIMDSDVEQFDSVWLVPRFATDCMLASSTDPAYAADDRDFLSRDTMVTFIEAQSVISFQYHPCLGGADESNTSPRTTIDIPTTGINVLVPVSETICMPKIAKYEVTISFSGGKQQLSYSINSDTSLPAYTPIFEQFDGDFDQWMQFSDGMSIYEDFAGNLNRSYRGTSRTYFEYPGPSENATTYTSSNGTVSKGCLLTSTQSQLNDETSPGVEVWPLSVFERRLAESIPSACPSFDVDMANELLANTTISALASSKVFDTVNGTELRPFNVYRFQNKIVFFLPYGLSLGLAIPIVSLGLIALYIRNHGISAITGGFLQLLMTTTGRTSIESVLATGGSTVGGYENVSDELREMEVGFGQLIVPDDVEDLLPSESRSVSVEVCADGSGLTQHEHGRANWDVEIASGAELCDAKRVVSRRAGFGTVHEIRPFKSAG